MKAPAYFQRELSVLDPALFAVWHPRKRRWQIRLWRRRFPTAYSWDSFEKESDLAMTVCNYDDSLNDVGYKPLDGRTIFALKKSKRESENPLETARQVDEANAKLDEEFERENRLNAKELASSIYNRFHTATVTLGG